MTLTIDDYSRLRSIVGSKVASVFSDPTLLRDLHQEIGRARLVEAGELPEGIIGINSTITLRDLQTNALEKYTLVEPTRADIANGRLSILSPVGVAVLGCRAGDEIQCPVATGWRRMTVEKVLPAVRRPASVHA
jgi:regulator of nucleoside diphosphate kinase